MIVSDGLGWSVVAGFFTKADLGLLPESVSGKRWQRGCHYMHDVNPLDSGSQS